MLEVNARTWLHALSLASGQPVRLATIPDSVFDAWQSLGLTHLWLMGVWPTGRLAREHALKQPALAKDFAQVLPDWTRADVGGSPYAVARYEVPAAWGGRAGLAAFRRKLHGRGIRLVLDFVPNHVGLDHAWVTRHPERLMQRRTRAAGSFPVETPAGTRWLAHGRDPYFPPWTDTAQVEIRRPETRRAWRRTLRDLAAQCDGVRCDMAMLLLQEVFARTWPQRGRGAEVASEFWEEAIQDVKAMEPGFSLIGEVYWGLEARLQQLGFDYTYDKGFLDAVVAPEAGAVPVWLATSAQSVLARGVHFLENHDEPRVASRFTIGEQVGPTLLMLSLPGMSFLQEGQLEGARHRLPVQLRRGPMEPVDVERKAMQQRLLLATREARLGEGEFMLLTPEEAWAGNPTWRGFVVALWRKGPDLMECVVVNRWPHRAQCRVSWRGVVLTSDRWILQGRLERETYERTRAELERDGLFLDMPGHAAQLFCVRPASCLAGPLRL